MRTHCLLYFSDCLGWTASSCFSRLPPLSSQYDSLCSPSSCQELAEAWQSHPGGERMLCSPSHHLVGLPLHGMLVSGTWSIVVRMNVYVHCASVLWRHICYLSPVPRSGSTLVWLAPTAPGPPPPSSVGKYLRHPATWQHVGAEGPCQPFRKEPLFVLSLSVLSLMCGAFCLSITEPGEIFSGIIMLCSS